MPQKKLTEGITFDDVSLVPARSKVLPTEVDVSTQVTRNIRINIPLVSSPMDTVTTSPLAIALAQEGGIGIIQRNLSIEAQCREVRKVKRSESGIIQDPVTLRPDQPVSQAQEIMSLQNISGVPITEESGRLVGILTRRDMKFLESTDKKIREVMTSENLVTGPPGTTLDVAEKILKEAKVEKLLLVNGERQLAGLITMRDVERSREYPQSCKDGRGRLRVGAAVGVRDFGRVEQLVGEEVDVIVVDSAHGHSEGVLETVREIRGAYSVEIVGGNIATGQAATDLVEAGADGLRVGIGPGAICTTRVVSGVGVPQLTAIMDCAEAGGAAGVPVMADGGIRFSGDITKAIAAGASSVMMGSLFAGLDESPGQLVFWRGRRFKEYRGMGSLGALMEGSDRYTEGDEPVRGKLVPEGVEGRVTYRGSLSEMAFQLVGGLRAGMGYCGAGTIDDLRQNGQFVRISAASVIEAHPHDINITKESPNYYVVEVDSQ